MLGVHRLRRRLDIGSACWNKTPGAQERRAVPANTQATDEEVACLLEAIQHYFPDFQGKKGAQLLDIYIDADACPVKQEVYRVAARYGLHVTVVANTPMRVPDSDVVELVVVDDQFNAADNWIVEQVTTNDIVVSADIPSAGTVGEIPAGIRRQASVFEWINSRKARASGVRVLALWMTE